MSAFEYLDVAVRVAFQKQNFETGLLTLYAQQGLMIAPITCKLWVNTWIRLVQPHLEADAEFVEEEGDDAT